MARRIGNLALFVCLSFYCAMDFAQEGPSAADVPIVDLNDFFRPETKKAFVDQVSKALHEHGFFAVINTGVRPNMLEKTYRATLAFFHSPLKKKAELFAPSLNGQRGYSPGETAQGADAKDFKEFFHIGRSDNLWPSWMNLESPIEPFLSEVDRHSEALQRAFALAIEEDEEYFTRRTRQGSCILRLTHYPPNPHPKSPWAAQHTDIDLFSIRVTPTEEGLHIFQEGAWRPVLLPPHAFFINGGDKLENLTNGYFKTSLNRVNAQANTERFSIVYFIHPQDDDWLTPLPRCVELTGGVRRFPEATSAELLACRLRELGLASEEMLEFEKQSGILDRMQELVDEGTAAPPVRRTVEIWKNYFQST